MIDCIFSDVSWRLARQFNMPPCSEWRDCLGGYLEHPDIAHSPCRTHIHTRYIATGQTALISTFITLTAIQTAPCRVVYRPNNSLSPKAPRTRYLQQPPGCRPWRARNAGDDGTSHDWLLAVYPKRPSWAMEQKRPAVARPALPCASQPPS